MVEVTTYKVRARRSGDWWALEVPEVPGVFSQAKRLEQVEPMIREAIALMLDMPEQKVAVDVDYDLPPTVLDALAELTRARVRKEEVERELSGTLRSTAATLVNSGLSYRDAGALSHISHQRVGQLVAASSSSRATRKPTKAVKMARDPATKKTAKRAASTKREPASPKDA